VSNHDEIRALLGAFALDAVDGEEHETVEIHLRYCPQCRAEMAEYREVAALIGYGGAPAPEGVWSRIVDALEPAPPRMRIEVDETGSGSVVPLEPPEPPVPAAPPVPAQSADGSRSGTSRLMLATLAAAAAVIAVIGLVGVRLADRIDSVDRRPTSGLTEVAAAALADPAARTTELRSSDRKIIARVALEPDGQGYLLAGTMPKLARDTTYQLWGSVGDQTISLGTFAGGTSVMPFRVDRSVSGLAVTKERGGGVAVSKNLALLSGKI